MDITREKLLQDLEAGYIDKSFYSNMEYLPQLLVNDKNAGKKVLTTIEQELRKCDDFWFSVAFVTSSGVAALINTFVDLESREVKGKLLVSQYLNFTQPEALKKLLKFRNIELKIAVTGNFHSKGYLFRKGALYDLIIGSSNLTADAMCSNKEWNLKVSATPESYIICNAIKEFKLEFEKAAYVNVDFISYYEELYKRQFEFNKLINERLGAVQVKEISPNVMQVEALSSIESLRSEGKNKALLISATGTGKTHLSAFDAKKFKPLRLLFVVHRANIAKAAMKTYESVFGNTKTMGMYSGSQREIDKDFIFSTIQTISKYDHLNMFDPGHFDYIVIDETHRAGAESYKRILDHFKPKYIMGMTATPERTDGLDIFKLFDHTIAYEIRLHKALDENMLSPFHYYGVTDITVNGETLEETADFSLLISDERIERIIEKAQFYGCDNGKVRGLVFCSRIDECKELSKGLNQRGYKTIALTGDNSEADRGVAINRLESDNPTEKLDYIFTVDIFNEGIDIPRVNQVIMLRPTQSAIIFVQQLGRGLRKADNKEYLTVIDFIGNYSNNYLIPIALFGDTSYNKDSLRKFLSSGSSLIPGASTINFDKISRDRIFKAIDAANMQLKKDLVNDYKLLKFKIGHIPMMMDFVEHGSRDPMLYVNYSKSYFNFAQEQEDLLREKLSNSEQKLLELFSKEINNSKRVEESIILSKLIEHRRLAIDTLSIDINTRYGYEVSDKTIISCVRNLNFEFNRERYHGALMTTREINDLHILKMVGGDLIIEPAFESLLRNLTFVKFLRDNISYSVSTYDNLFDASNYCNGFVLYRKYSRKDVFRILNWETNPVAQNVGGYMISQDSTSCPIFVNYHKEESISSTTKYDDRFVNNSVFEWMSKSNRTLNSPDVQMIMNYRQGLRLPLFIKKNNDEGAEFYFMGDITPVDNGFEQTVMPDDHENNVSVVKVKFNMNQPVSDSMYNYIISTDE